MFRQITLVCALASVFSACGWLYETKPADIDLLPTQQPVDRAITKIVQTVNLPAADNWGAVNDILKQRGIPVAESDTNTGKIVTQWVPIIDSPCGVYPASGAPLSCQVRYTAEIQGLGPVASSFTIEYSEFCTGKEKQPLECPGSNAEKLMIAIVQDLKTLAGVID